tara:strand:- start:297 stop:461 length:165 start_codon:yes stop_codon:yes gene_type:complete
MFYEVRLLDRKNKIKKIITSEQLSRQYWDKFEHTFNVSKGKLKTVGQKSTASNN